MTTTTQNATTVRILNKDFHINCPEGKEEELLQAAHFLDQKMAEINKSGRVMGADKVAIMAGLNITYELLETQHQVGRINSKLESAFTINHTKTEVPLSTDSE